MNSGSAVKVYVENFLPDSAITRIADALKKYLPQEHELVNSKDDADFVVVCAYGHRRSMKYYTERLLKQNKKYAIVQLSVRSTPNPGTQDWLPIWEKAKLVWSYYDLHLLCKEDGTLPNFNFYHAPLGVDSEIFKETKSERNFIIASTGNGRRWNKECKAEIMLAAEKTGKKVFHLGPGENNGTITYSNGMNDGTLATYYSQCEFVSGLRRVEGFELPVIEGLLCGARPICFDRQHYKQWFEGLAEFIPEDEKRVESIQNIFTKGARPVTEKEKEYVRTHFNWKEITGEFWKQALI